MSRGLPHFIDAQRRKSWKPVRASAQPPDLQGQTIVIVGMGTIGATVARFAQTLGMHVIGIRRKPRSDDDPVDASYLAGLGLDAEPAGHSDERQGGLGTGAGDLE